MNKKNIRFTLLFLSASLGISWMGQVIDTGHVAAILGIGRKLWKTFFDVSGSIIKGQLGDGIKKISKSFSSEKENLSNSIRKAYQKTIKETLEDFHDEYSVDEDFALSDLNIFADSLLDVLSDEELLRELLENNAQLKPDEYLHQLFSHKKISYPLSFGIEQVQSFFENGFKTYFPKYFLEEIKYSELVKTEYFKYLLESLAVQTANLNKHFDLIKDVVAQAGFSIHELFTNTNEANQQRTDSVYQWQSLVRENQLTINTKLDKLLVRVTSNLEPYLHTRVFADADRTFHKSPFRFDFTTRYTNFVGRNRELHQLWNFIESDLPFSWCMITGPGGAGKSRLAQEFAIRARDSGYNAGFYQLQTGETARVHEWERWQFQQPTLLLIDYALHLMKDVCLLIKTLYSKFETENHNNTKVRILLIDRKTTKEWDDRILWPELALSAFRPENKAPFLALDTLDDSDLWKIIAQICQDNGKTIDLDPVDLIAKLSELDRQKRPLYTFFVGVALAEGNNIRDWNIDNLLQHHLSRLESKIWDSLPGYRKDASKLNRLLLINTFSRSLDANAMTETLRYLDIDKLLVSSVYNHMADVRRTAEKATEWLGILPDLLGEYFVMMRSVQLLQQDFEAANREEALDLLSFAWNLRPSETRQMFGLCHEDFGDTFPEFSRLIISKEFGKRLSKSGYSTYFSLRTGMIRALQNKPDTYKNAQMYYDLSNAQGDSFDDADGLFYSLANIDKINARSRLIIHLSQQDPLSRERTWQVYEELKELAVRGDALYQVAGACHNMITSLLKENGDWTYILIIYEELKQWSDKYALEEINRLRFQSGLGIIFYTSMEDPWQDKAFELFEGLKPFIPNKLDSQDIYQLYKASFNLITYPCHNERQWARAFLVYLYLYDLSKPLIAPFLKGWLISGGEKLLASKPAFATKEIIALLDEILVTLKKRRE